MYPAVFTEREKDLLHKIADFLFQVEEINEVSYLSDGISETGRVGFFYRPNVSELAGEVYYKAYFTGTGLYIESEQSTEIPVALKQLVESRFSQTIYVHKDNWHHWAGVYLAEILNPSSNVAGLNMHLV